MPPPKEGPFCIFKLITIKLTMDHDKHDKMFSIDSPSPQIEVVRGVRAQSWQLK